MIKSIFRPLVRICISMTLQILTTTSNWQTGIGSSIGFKLVSWMTVRFYDRQHLNLGSCWQDRKPSRHLYVIHVDLLRAAVPGDAIQILLGDGEEKGFY